MKVAVIYDIHANLPALEAVLKDVADEDPDFIVIGGDVVPGPMPRETITCLLDLSTPMEFICGNGDREVLAQMMGTETDWYRNALELWREPVRWSAKQLDDEHRHLIASWPATHRVEIRGLGEVLFCHATPRNDTEIFTRKTAEKTLAPIFEAANAPLVVCGHTHMQFDRRIGEVRVVNAGSVGMPYGKPGAYWLLLGPDVQLRHTPYDLSRAGEKIRQTEYPQAEAYAHQSVLAPPSEEDILEMFSRAELAE